MAATRGAIPAIETPGPGLIDFGELDPINRATQTATSRRAFGFTQRGYVGCQNDERAKLSDLNFSVPLAQAVVGYGASEMVWNAPGSSALYAHGGGLLAGLLVNYLAMTRSAFYDKDKTLGGETHLRRGYKKPSMCVAGMNAGPIYIGADNLVQSLTAGVIMYMLAGSKHALVAAGGGFVGGVGVSSYYNRKNQ